MSQRSRPLSRKVHQYAADLQTTVSSVATGIDSDLYLFFGQLIAPRDGGHVHGFTVTRYWYQLVDDSYDPYVRFEWDPGADPPWPHLHLHRVDLSGDEPATLLGRPMKKLHITTGRVLLEDVIRFLVRDGIVEPLDHDRYHSALGASLTWARLASWGTLRED